LHIAKEYDEKLDINLVTSDSSSEFVNYNGTFSMILAALVDNTYHFIFVNTGCQGRIDDGHVLLKYHFNEQTQYKITNVPTRSITALKRITCTICVYGRSCTHFVRMHTHTHISNEKIPQKLQEESRRTSSVLFHVPAGSLQMFLVQLPVSHVLGNQCYFNQTCFQILS
jgi:hypothetical protein